MTELVLDSLLIEVCVDSVQSAVAATLGGADRLEICANLGAGGGTTPSLGLVKSIQKAVRGVPLMILIRPRIGDFLYSKEEIDVILEDVRMFKNIGDIRGFVVGALTQEGRVDVEVMKVIVDEILPLEVCFHRAFDMARDPIEAMVDITDIGGISRILTSGQKPTAHEGLKTIEKLFRKKRQLVEDDNWGLTIMPGSGVNRETIVAILSALLPLGLREVHLSGGAWSPGQMYFKRTGMGMGLNDDPNKEFGIWRTQEEEIRRLKEVMEPIWHKFIESAART